MSRLEYYKQWAEIQKYIAAVDERPKNNFASNKWYDMPLIYPNNTGTHLHNYEKVHRNKNNYGRAYDNG